MREERYRRRPPDEQPRERPPTRDVAELKAVALLAEAHIERPPVDVETCAGYSGIKLVTYSSIGSHSAVLSVPYGIPSVVVNMQHPKVRQRFSLAHEIGHWVLERAPATHDMRPIASRGRRYDELERICDYFAACLLMPRNWIRDRAEAGATNVEMAKAFDVSASALLGRLRELGYHEKGR